MKKILFTILLIAGIATTIIFAQRRNATASNGVTHTQTLTGTTIEGIDAGGSFDIIVTQGATSSALIEVPERFKNDIEAKITNCILTLGFKPRGIFNTTDNEKFTATITCPTLTLIRLSGATDLKINSPFTCQNFNLNISGSSDFKSAYPITVNASKAYFAISGASDLTAPFIINGAAQLVASGSSDFKSNITVAQHLSATVSGASDMELSGQSASLKLDISGSADFKGKGFQTKKAEISASGASNTTIKVTDQISARTSGSSEVRYTGNPAVIKRY